MPTQKPLENRFSWSKSRDRMFQECPRAYYYQYYGSWGGWEKSADKRTRLLYVLKNLETRHIWAGDKVHKAVAQALEAVRLGIPPPTADGMVRRTLETMRAEFKDSRGGRQPQDPKRTLGLFEHAYDLQLKDEEWKTVAEHVESCIRTFLDSVTFAGIGKVPAADWLEVEQLNTIDIDGTRVYVQLDFAHRSGDGAIIYDWKTGRSDQSSENSIQFACYALYATQAWRVPADKLQTIEFNVAKDEIIEHAVTEEVIQEVRYYILESAGEMEGFLDDVENNSATEDAFPLADEAHVCRHCNFRKACPRFA
jgi:hypothetical protein